MKNKIIYILITIIILIIICITYFSILNYKNANKNIINEEIFVKLYKYENGYIVYDKRTRIQYAISKSGIISILYNSNGNPLLYNNH